MLPILNIALLEGIGHAKEFTQRELVFYSHKVEKQSAHDFIDTFTGDLDTANDRLAHIEESFELMLHQKLVKPTQKNIQETCRSMQTASDPFLKNWYAKSGRDNCPEILFS